MRIFLTGGTGFIGSYIAEAARAAGHEVRALARPTSDAQLLESMGAEIVRGDLGEADTLRAGAEGCDVVVHAAAKVGDWAPWETYYEETVAASRRVYDAAVAAGVGRAVHVSSVAVYGKEGVRRGVVNETQGPVPEAQLPRWYYYARAKSLAEEVAMEFHASGRLPTSVVRPAWVYGPRDRASLPRVLAMLEQGRMQTLGDGANIIGLTYAANVADAILLAATREEAVGEAFNVANDQRITQREYICALADMLGVPQPTRQIPVAAALGIAAVLETVHRGLKLSRRPFVTRQAVELVGLPNEFATEKIRDRLGWTPKVDFATAIDRIRTWWAGARPAHATPS